MKKKIIRVRTKQNPYNVIIINSDFSNLPHLFKIKPGRGFIIFDYRLKKKVSKLALYLEKCGWDINIFEIRVSEEFKDFKEIYPLYGRLLKAGADRNSVIFAVGGGVIGDAIGFIAGTYLRGVSLVCFPTTLLSQVDSAIGGKTAINHDLGKNLIGIFHQPKLVVCDLSYLDSLAVRDRISGLGEIIKYAVIYDRDFFFYLKKNWEDILILKKDVLIYAISKCIHWKARAIEKDEFDKKGIREVLNFGHTLGHAMEASVGFGKIRHGEAVLLGMRAALFLSVKRGHLAQSTHLVIDNFLRKIPLPKIPKNKHTKLIKLVKFDKKKKDGKIRFILLRDIGSSIVDSGVKDEEILEALEFISNKNYENVINAMC